MGDCYGPDHPCDPLTDIAANPLDADFLMGLEPAVGEHVFFGLLHNTMGEPEVYRRVADAFFAYCRGREIGRLTTGSRSMRRKMMAVSGAARHSIILTLTPECRPTPEALTSDLRVRCLSMCAKTKTLEKRKREERARF